MSSHTVATATQDITLLRDAEFQILLWEFRHPPILGQPLSADGAEFFEQLTAGRPGDVPVFVRDS